MAALDAGYADSTARKAGASRCLIVLCSVTRELPRARPARAAGDQRSGSERFCDRVTGGQRDKVAAVASVPGPAGGRTDRRTRRLLWIPDASSRRKPWTLFGPLT
jgi:hypothetical protein